MLLPVYGYLNNHSIYCFYAFYVQSSPSGGEGGGEGNIAEIMLLVGPPACGKSTLARSLQHTHVRVNQDLLKNKKACFQAAADHFLSLEQQQIPSATQPQGVVIDATNSNRSTRREWIDFARAHNVVSLL
jgi:predicted kinase